jgi:hypothetical protein
LRDSAGLEPASPLCPGIRAGGHPYSENGTLYRKQSNRPLNPVQRPVWREGHGLQRIPAKHGPEASRECYAFRIMIYKYYIMISVLAQRRVQSVQTVRLHPPVALGGKRRFASAGVGRASKLVCARARTRWLSTPKEDSATSLFAVKSSAGRLNNRCNRPWLTPGMTMIYVGRLSNQTNPIFCPISRVIMKL